MWIARRPPAAQVASGVYLARRSRPPSAYSRRGRRSLRPRPPLLDDEFFYQGEGKPGLRLLAPGFNLLGLEPARCSDGLGRLYPSERWERRDGGNPRQQ